MDGGADEGSVVVVDVLDELLEARVGIAPDVALLVQDGAVVGWSPTDPVRYVTTGFGAPDPAPPAPSTRVLLTACMDLVTTEESHLT
ncbi:MULTISPECIES: hypothetical protein [unclassified Streptomyces]|uniref:hypothetical protein n=1 Tax=unclassified Streptomyces TaxID=2593676 RepID=UPI0033A1279C